VDRVSYHTLRDYLAREKPQLLERRDAVIYPQGRYSPMNILSSLFLKPEEKFWIEKLDRDPEPREYVLYIGCNVLQTPFLLWTCVDVLKKMGIDFVAVGGGHLCCGSPFIKAGKIEAAESFDRRRIETFARFKPRVVIEWDASCSQFTRLYTLNYIKPCFEIKSIEGFIAENLEKMRFTRRVESRVAIHDHYGYISEANRSDFDYETPRRVLRALPGLELVELPHNRGEALPCSFESPGNEEVDNTIMEEAAASRIDTLAVFWQACYRTLIKPAARYGIESRHFIELVGEAMGVRHVDNYKRYKLMGDLDLILRESRRNLEANGYSVEEVRPFLERYLSIRPA